MRRHFLQQLVYVSNGCQICLSEWWRKVICLCGARWFWDSDHQALYCSKQAPNSWYDKVNYFFLPIKFQWCSANNLYSLYHDGLICLVILYVDELLITVSFETKIEQLHNYLKAPFRTDLGLPFTQMEPYFSARLVIFDKTNFRLSSFNNIQIKPQFI